jgi:hypothetical protein
VVDCENALYFECKTCDNFITCLACIKQKTRRLVSHPSDHYFIPNRPISNTNWKQRNLNITCNLCGEKHFSAKHYKCRQCSDYNVCSKCLSEAQQTHCSSEHHIFIYISNPTKLHINRCLLASRALKILKYRDADRDEITGWTFNEAQLIYENEMNNYSEAWKKACQIFEDDDIDFKPSIIEHTKTELPLVLIENY